jgi:hypothetical protein
MSKNFNTMKNLLILYNPYYQKDVIEQHLALLKEHGAVAFGKVKSKIRDYEHPNEEILDVLYENISKTNPLQLFLTDYNSMYVANVIAVKKEKTKFIKAPLYYDELEVEQWFVFDDLRLLALNDFQHIRDNILANFKAVNYNDRTYAIYGNHYVYPMQVTMKEDVNYFEKDEEDFKFFTNIFKSDEQIKMRTTLIDFNFGSKKFNTLAPNSQDNIISAEVEYHQNKQNPLYDFASVVIKYSKAVELEMYRFMKLLFVYLMDKDPSIKTIPYSVQGRDYVLEDILTYKPNYGTYKYLIKNQQINNALFEFAPNAQLKYFIVQDVVFYINTMQSVRNESVHGGTTSLEECDNIRKHVIGIGKNGIFKGVLEISCQSDRILNSKGQKDEREVRF